MNNTNSHKPMELGSGKKAAKRQWTKPELIQADVQNETQVGHYPVVLVESFFYNDS